jgi:hypothetical protein
MDDREEHQRLRRLLSERFEADAHFHREQARTYTRLAWTFAAFAAFNVLYAIWRAFS